MINSDSVPIPYHPLSTSARVGSRNLKEKKNLDTGATKPSRKGDSRTTLEGCSEAAGTPGTRRYQPRRPDVWDRTAPTEAKARGSSEATKVGRLLVRKDVTLVLDIAAVEHYSCGLWREGTRMR